MSNKIEVKLQIELIPAGDACFMDVDAPAGATAVLGTHICIPDQVVTEAETEALVDVMRYVAANENLASAALEAGLLTRLRIEDIRELRKLQFPRALRLLVSMFDEETR